MNEVKEKIKELKNSNKFWNFILDGKNIAIILLSFLLLCFLIAYSDSNSYKYFSQLEDLTSQINGLNTKNNELNNAVEDNKKQITNLQDANKLLQEEKSTLEKEKQELNTKIKELEEISSTKTIETSPQVQSSSNNTSPSTTPETSSETSAPNTTTNSEMVWVGETGTKYHNEGCRTLKGKGHQITMQQALAEGRQPCKVCH